MYEETPEVQITLDKEKNESAMRLSIAKTFIKLHGDQAHLVALQELLNDTQRPDEWRDILNLIDRLTGESK